MPEGAPIEVRESPIHGRGVFATAPISAGDHISSFVGHRTADDGDHVLWIRTDTGWLGWEGTGSLRWLNHHRPPNAEFVDLDLYALNQIAPNDEITIDYGPDWINQ